MTLQIRGYAAQSASAPLTAHRFERRAPRADDLVIDILYCGVCHSTSIRRATNGTTACTRWCRATRSSAGSPASARR